jgi:Protein of unknown function (DUF3040)
VNRRTTPRVADNEAENRDGTKMSLSVAEERALTRIEQVLRSRDPRLNSLFSIFTRLTRQEAMPAIEQIRRRRWRPQPGAVFLVAVALLVCAVGGGSLATAHGCLRAPAGATARPSAIAIAGAAATHCPAHQTLGSKAP